MFIVHCSCLTISESDKASIQRTFLPSLLPFFLMHLYVFVLHASPVLKRSNPGIRSRCLGHFLQWHHSRRCRPQRPWVSVLRRPQGTTSRRTSNACKREASSNAHSGTHRSNAHCGRSTGRSDLGKQTLQGIPSLLKMSLTGTPVCTRWKVMPPM